MSADWNYVIFSSSQPTEQGSLNSLEKMEPLQFIEYLRNLKMNKEENVCILPWRKGVMRNCEQSGKFIKPDSMSKYKHQVPSRFSVHDHLDKHRTWPAPGEIKIPKKKGAFITGLKSLHI